MHRFPSTASAFFDAMNAASEADRRDARRHLPRKSRANASGRWAALALVPALLVAVAWML